MNLLVEIEKEWSWAGLRPVEIVAENAFGNLIIKDDCARFWRLCPEEVYCKIVADNEKNYENLSNNKDFIDDWSMSSITAQAIREFGPLETGWKFHLVVPGVLGGEYDLSNIVKISCVEQIRTSGTIGKQLCQVSDGEQVRIKVTE